MGCGNSRQLDDRDVPVELLPSVIPEIALDSQQTAAISSTPSSTSSLLTFRGIKVGLQLLCKDEFVSKYTGDKMCRWRKSEVRTVELSDNSRVMIHYVGWSENFDFWLDLHTEWSKVAPMELLSKNQCDQGLPLNDEQERITHNYLVTGKFSKRNLPPVLNRSSSNNTTHSNNSSGAAPHAEPHTSTPHVTPQKTSSSQQYAPRHEPSTQQQHQHSQQQHHFEQEIPAEAMVPHFYVGQMVRRLLL